MSEDLERIKGKIKKLLTLAECGCNEHESANAAAKARALMDRYQIDLMDLPEEGPQDSIGSQEHGFASARWPEWKQSLAVRVATVNDCFVRFERGIGGKVLVFQGFLSDTQLCVEMYDHLVVTINHMAEEYRRTGAFSAMVSAYRQGLEQTISSRLRAIADNRKKELISSNGTALVVVKMNQVEARFGKAKYAKGIGFDTSQADAMRAAAFHKGRADGRTVKINEELQ